MNYLHCLMTNAPAALLAFVGVLTVVAVALLLKHLFSKGSSFELNLQIKTRGPGD